VKSAIAASGESGALTTASASAPPCFAASTLAMRSGLRPDWEIARHSICSALDGAP
jgi:hypothetical protein